MAAFTIDGKAYNVTVKSMKRSFSVLDTDKSGRVQAKGKMERDIIGTFYNYTLEIETKAADKAEYDVLYDTLSAPVASHIISVPYAQGVKTFEAYVTSGGDNLVRKDEFGSRWSGLSIDFVAMEAARTP